VNSGNSSIDNIVACDSYTWIDGVTYTESTNTPIYTIPSTGGCDSVVTLNLTINHSTTGTAIVTACGSYTWIDGITYTQSTNTPTYTLTAANGCDSVVTLNLTINQPTTGSDVQVVCDSFTWIDGVTYTESTNTPTYILTAVNGCDSVVTLNLTINHSIAVTDTVVACGSYTWIDGNTYTQSTNTPTYTFTSISGCDSVVTLNLTINPNTTGIDTQVSCDSYTWIDGVTYTESTNTPTYTLTSANGCDSVVTLNLTINLSVHDTIVDTAINEYIWNGTTYTESGVYMYEGVTATGCDSIVTLILTIQTIGIEGVDILESLTFYPNPTTGIITFNRTDIIKVEVLDAVGRMVAVYANSYVIDLSKLAKGYYTLRITTAEGVAVRKVIRK
ncbi:MAG: T9SS type A sorting domain-containing protein, partial [Bacteroidales bacterium]|nr:T9SS type A sorting domain-containing protein [Bacteroidales bacterium]